MNVQETIERDVRIILGDLHLQLIATRARVAELETELASYQQPIPAPPAEQPAPAKAKPNGAAIQ